jgi:Uma2 family endonuclease
MATQKTLYTAEDLLRLPDTGKRYELVRGELLEMAPTSFGHGRVTGHAFFRLFTFVQENDLGEVLTGEPGFRLQRNPDTVRAPDIAFVSKDRIPADPRGFPDLAPDLVVEVVSPNDTAAELQVKVGEWLRAGTRMVLVMYPDSRLVAVYRSLNDVRVLTEDDVLQGEPVLPGFSCPVRDLF